MTFASWIQKRRRARGDYNDEATRQKLRMPKSRKTIKQNEPRQQAALNLIEIELPPSAPSSTALEVSLANGIKINVLNESQLPLLKALICELSC